MPAVVPSWVRLPLMEVVWVRSPLTETSMDCDLDKFCWSGMSFSVWFVVEIVPTGMNVSVTL